MSFVAPVRFAAPSNQAISTRIVPLSAIPEDWDTAWCDLALEAAESNAFAESWFMRAAIRHLGPPANARMLSVWQGPLLLGLIPLSIASRYGRMRVRHVENWLHYHAFLGTPLVRAGSEDVFWRAALDALDEADWAPAFLHVIGLAAGGSTLAALTQVRRTDIVHRSQRALLQSPLCPIAYYETNVRKKKRKEIGRLQSRLNELGNVQFAHLTERYLLTEWIDDFLTLEASGWKGRAGTALRDDPCTRAFFKEAVEGAFTHGRLDILRLTLDGRPIAMLVNFLTAPGGFSFKIAFDEDFARFSPGVLLQLENLQQLDNEEIDWMDSCAVADHTMINSLWAERREIVRVTVPLNGWRRRATFAACRTLERGAALVRKLR